jgi:hypothetical protein
MYVRKYWVLFISIKNIPFCRELEDEFLKKQFEQMNMNEDIPIIFRSLLSLEHSIFFSMHAL